MTLLITTVGRDYALAASDLRITSMRGAGITVEDESFNKHILFNSGNLNANISYTGVARWRHDGNTITLYEVISNSLARLAPMNLGFAPLFVAIMEDIIEAVSISIFKGRIPDLELHVLTRHALLPVPMVAVLSTFRKEAPWSGRRTEETPQWEWDLGTHFVFMKAFVDETDVIFGGSEYCITEKERAAIREAVASGADAFNASIMSANLVRAGAGRTKMIGESSVSIAFPSEGYIDTNLWKRDAGQVIAFLPRMVGSNGASVGPSEFPVTLDLIADGHLPRNSLFLKSIMRNKVIRKRMRRLAFRYRGGPMLPGIFGMVGLALYGKVAPGYADFGLGGRE